MSNLRNYIFKLGIIRGLYLGKKQLGTHFINVGKTSQTSEKKYKLSTKKNLNKCRLICTEYVHAVAEQSGQDD